MSKLGSYPGSKVVQAFQNAGWSISRKSGSHIIMEKPDYISTLSVPVHKGKDVKRGTLRDLIKDAGISVKEFINVLKIVFHTATLTPYTLCTYT